MGIAGALGLSLMLAGAVAYACTNLASLNTDSAAVAEGDTLTLTGSSFGPNGEVEVHWNGVEGPVLATVPTDAAGNITATVTVPADAAPGYYTLVATQMTENGPQFGTPARAAIQVTGPGGETLVAPAEAGQTLAFASGSDGASAGLIALTAILGVAGLALFGAGLRGFARPSAAQAPAPVRSE